MISIARETFLDRIRILSDALNDSALSDLSLIPQNRDHNERARFFRNGLSIIAFNILEDFLKNRTSELLNSAASSGVSFAFLPEKMHSAVLLDSLSGIQKIAIRKKKDFDDWQLFINQETTKISSSSTIPFQVSTYGIGWDKSNLEASDITNFMGIFQINGGWQSIYRVSTIIGCTLIAPEDFFKNSARRRHSAAHNPTTTLPLNDLIDFSKMVKTLALSFDMLLSHATKLILSNDTGYLVNKIKVEPTDLKIRYIQKTGGTFKEMSQNNSKSIASFTNEVDAVNSLVNRLNYNNEMIAIIEMPSQVFNWYTTLP